MLPLLDRPVLDWPDIVLLLRLPLLELLEPLLDCPLVELVPQQAAALLTSSRSRRTLLERPSVSVALPLLPRAMSSRSMRWLLELLPSFALRAPEMRNLPLVELAELAPLLWETKLPLLDCPLLLEDWEQF